VAKDLDGNPRIQDATGRGYPIIDMGAYEYNGLQETGPTTLLLTPSAYEVKGGSNLVLAAKLISPNGTPAGTVTFFEDGYQLGASSIDGTGSGKWTVNSAVPGTHIFLATYPGQSGFTPATSVKVYVVVDAYGVTLTLASTPNPSLLGQAVAFKATISYADGVPPGLIALSDGAVTLANLTPDANGIATFSTSSLAAGTHYISASYRGSTTYLSATASVTQQVVNGYTTDTSITSSLNPANSGQTVTFTATVKSTRGVPTGSVTFSDGSTTLAAQTLNNGVAIYSTNSLSAGSHTITAAYGAGGTFAGSTGSLTEVINGLASTTALAAPPNPANALQQVTLTATVKATTGAPTGTVRFFDGGVSLGSAALAANGTSTLSTSFFSSGAHSLTATYAGDSIFNAILPKRRTFLPAHITADVFKFTCKFWNQMGGYPEK
jgi:hypothetical protein